MKPLLKKINDAALKTKNMNLFNVGQTLQKVMKEFFLYMKSQRKDLTNCSYNTFGEWYLNEGLSTTYGRLQSMRWENDLETQLFDHYSSALMELEERQEQMDDAVEENIQYRESLSSQNMKSTCMSSTIVHTPDQHAGASTSKGLGTSLQMQTPQKKLKDGPIVNSDVPEGEVSLFKAENGRSVRRGGNGVCSGRFIPESTKDSGGRERTGSGIKSPIIQEEKERFINGIRREHGRNSERRRLFLYGRQSCPSSLISNKGRRRTYQYIVAGRSWIDGYKTRALPFQRVCKTQQKSILDEANIFVSRSDLWRGFACI
ncbi:unnamed protein product [Diatraea saccharalis]|uniref:Uncharacterized protein n=1 Tax=Diatraea saccharalis TaxID=40085 RepID=A0A9N9WGD7_9NEOP|nr:unnamed protein product [Diatraea saccharalis]